MPKSSNRYRRQALPAASSGFIRTYSALDLIDSAGGAQTANHLMKDHLKHFKRELPGLWTCLVSISIDGVTIPSGARFIAGVLYEGIDVAGRLEEEYANQQKG